jgi:hypothetical protein
MKKNHHKILVLLFFLLIGGLFASKACTQNLDQANMRANLLSEYLSSDSIKTAVKSPTRAMIRSLVFPGWGQWYNNKKFKALLIFGTEIGLLANSIYLNQKYLEWDQKFKESEPGYEQDVIFANREFYINNRNSSNWWLVGAILFSMADAFVDAHLSNFDESSNLSFLNISPMGDGNYTGIRLSICLRY